MKRTFCPFFLGLASPVSTHVGGCKIYYSYRLVGLLVRPTVACNKDSIGTLNVMTLAVGLLDSNAMAFQFPKRVLQSSLECLVFCMNNDGEGTISSTWSPSFERRLKSPRPPVRALQGYTIKRDRVAFLDSGALFYLVLELGTTLVS